MMATQLGERFEDALVYATRLHTNQVRKVGGTPYIAHLLSVAALVLEDGGSEDEAIAALLHDAIEDQGGQTTRDEIRQRFGDRVAIIVEGCTESDVIPKPPWKERKLQYLQNLQNASPEVLRVSLADKLHNARSLLMAWREQGDRIWDEFHGTRAEKLWFYSELSHVYQEKHSSSLSQELEWVLELLRELESQKNDRSDEGMTRE